MQHTVGKLSTRANFSSNFISIECLHAKLWAPKILRVLVVRILGLRLGSLGTKCHLDMGLLERHKVYHKGEGGGFLEIRAVVSLVSLTLLVARPSTKSVPTMY